MTRDPLSEEAYAILANVLKLNRNEIKPELKLQEDLAIDSVDFWDVIAAFDKKFKVRISEKEAASLVTVADLIEILEKKQKAATSILRKEDG